MLESALILLMNSLLLMLRITPGESFARPLSHEDEQNISLSGRRATLRRGINLLNIICALCRIL